MTAVVSAEDQFVRDGSRICYRLHGSPSDEPLLLVAGLGQQLTSWPAAMIDAFVARGFFVIAFDNRDVGRSHRATTPPPGLLRLLLRRPRADGYDLADMSRDAIALLDHLRVPDAHVVGMSMGGMVGQTLAALYPARVRTLTSIFSTTGARGVGQPAVTTILRLAMPQARTRVQAVANHVAMFRHIGAGPFPLDVDAIAAYAALAWDRGDGRRARTGVRHQINAILRSGDRTAALRRVAAPTLVIHGDRDLMVHPSGGRATADAIPRARLVTIPGMRHHLAGAVIPRLVELITHHLQQHAHDLTSRAAGAMR